MKVIFSNDISQLQLLVQQSIIKEEIEKEIKKDVLIKQLTLATGTVIRTLAQFLGSKSKRIPLSQNQSFSIYFWIHSIQWNESKLNIDLMVNIMH